MFIFAEIFRSLASMVDIVAGIFSWLIIARAIVSFLPVDPYHSIVQFLVQVTDPILAPFQRLPLRVGMLDFSVLVAFFAIRIVRVILVGFFWNLAVRFGGA